MVPTLPPFPPPSPLTEKVTFLIYGAKTNIDIRHMLSIDAYYRWLRRKLKYLVFYENEALRLIFNIINNLSATPILWRMLTCSSSCFALEKLDNICCTNFTKFKSNRNCLIFQINIGSPFFFLSYSRCGW